MKDKYLPYLIILLISYNLFAQGSGQLIAPKMSIPNSIVGRSTGYICIKYLIDKYGQIHSYELSNIFLSKIKNKKIVVKTIYDIKFPKRNTKRGIIMAKRLQSWVFKYGKLTRYEKTKNSDLDKMREGDLVIDGLSITFGDEIIKNELKKIDK